MRAVMVMFDTLTRNYLSTYGNDWCVTPNFKRLEETCCVMNRFYGGSMPCMPARREIHTGKYNFLHRSWGPLEPFDFSVMQYLSDHGIYTHLVTDHSHYFEDGGGTYHNRYSTWEGFRGQEGDRWVAWDTGFEIPESSGFSKKGLSVLQHQANKSRMVKEEELSGVRTMEAGIDFLKSHNQLDHWFLQIETFDPHEPFYVPEKYRKQFDLPEKVHFNWPAYMPVDEGENQEELWQARKEYGALLAMCDEYLGRILDVMDENDMWRDTMLIVNTDHGFLLGEHNYLGKNFWPMHQEIIHTPFYIHVPGCEAVRRESLCSTVDLAPTLLDYFGLEIPGNMEGRSLLPVVNEDKRIHDTVLFGSHGGHVCITDGDYVFMKAAVREDNSPYVECTLMPTHMRGFLSREELMGMQLQKGDLYSGGVPYLKIPSKTYLNSYLFGDSLWDVREGECEIHSMEIENRLTNCLVRSMVALEAPEEEFERLGLNANERSYNDGIK